MPNPSDELNKMFDSLSQPAKDALFQFVLQNLMQNMAITTIKDLMSFKNNVETRLAALEKQAASKPRTSTKKTAS